MKVAFATTDGIKVDEHFGRAGKFAVYEMDKDGYSMSGLREFAPAGDNGRDEAVEGTRGMGPLHERRVQSKVDALSDCRIIYLNEIGGPSAARLSGKGIMPVKVKEGTPIEEALCKLLETIRTSPPPWLRKALAEDRD